MYTAHAHAYTRRMINGARMTNEYVDTIVPNE